MQRDYQLINLMFGGSDVMIRSDDGTTAELQKGRGAAMIDDKEHSESLIQL